MTAPDLPAAAAQLRAVVLRDEQWITDADAVLARVEAEWPWMLAQAQRAPVVEEHLAVMQAHGMGLHAWPGPRAWRWAGEACR